MNLHFSTCWHDLNSVKLFIMIVVIATLLLGSIAYADWESDANARIEQIRKRDVQITVVDSLGDPVPNLIIQINQTKQSFPFGSAINTNVSNSQYTNFFKNHYNWAVMENESKWYSNEPSRDYVTYSSADTIYNFCSANDITMRGHCIFWASENTVQDWVKALPYAPYPASSELLDEVMERMDSAVNHFKGKFVHWDVNNEMSNNSFYEDRLGIDIHTWMFQAAHTIDPDCVLFLNDYNVISGGWNLNTFYQKAVDLLSRGAPLHALGVQCHMGGGFNRQDALNRFDTLAQLNLPVWVTEFDVSQADENLRADDLEDFYRLAFSHPSVEGIIMWGFWENSHWRDNCYIVNSDWTLNAAGIRYESLMDEWTTYESGFTNDSGNIDFRGFHGTYTITLTAPAQTPEVYTIVLDPGTTTAVYEIETVLLPIPDTTAPDPDPMIWAVGGEPAATGSTSIMMTAETASDDSPPVYYYFECTTDSSASSTWQTSPTYEAVGLDPSTLYTFRVKARDNYPTPNETEWSDPASATTDPASPTGVEILGNWTTGTTHNVEPGQNRALILFAYAEHSDGTVTLNSVTYGSQPMTQIIDQVEGAGAGYYSANVTAFILDEDGITAASNGTFVPVWDTTPGAIVYTSIFLENVDQTSMIGAKDSESTTVDNPIVTNALSTEDGDMVFAAATCGNLSSYTLNNDFTESFNQQFGDATTGGTGVTGFKYATGAAETPSVTYNASINRQVIIGFVIQAAPDNEFQNCMQVQYGGYRLLSDFNRDCYVNFSDVEVFAHHWLDTDCAISGNCEYSDFEPDGDVDLSDFGNFGMQWMDCNNPSDPGCTPNW